MSNPNNTNNQAPVATTATAESAAPKTGVLNTVSALVKTEVTPEVRKLKLKVDQNEVEMSESEVIALAQKGQGAEKRFQEAAQMRKEAEAVVKFLRENPREAMKQFGIDVRKFSEDVLMEHLTEQSLTPEQKKQRDTDTELKKYRDREKAETERQQKELTAKQEQELVQHYTKTFSEALEASGLPKTNETVARMARYQQQANRKGYEVPPADLAKLVRSDYEAEQKALYSNLDGDKLMEVLGKDIVSKLSKAQIAKLKAGQPTHTKVAPQKKVQDKAVSTSKQSTQDWKTFQKNNRRPI
jgi:hypothetical protein